MTDYADALNETRQPRCRIGRLIEQHRGTEKGERISTLVENRRYLLRRVAEVLTINEGQRYSLSQVHSHRSRRCGCKPGWGR